MTAPPPTPPRTNNTLDSLDCMTLQSPFSRELSRHLSACRRTADERPPTSLSPTVFDSCYQVTESKERKEVRRGLEAHVRPDRWGPLVGVPVYPAYPATLRQSTTPHNSRHQWTRVLMGKLVCPLAGLFQVRQANRNSVRKAQRIAYAEG